MPMMSAVGIIHKSQAYNGTTAQDTQVSGGSLVQVLLTCAGERVVLTSPQDPWAEVHSCDLS